MVNDGTSNIKNYPYNIFEPRIIEGGYKLYRASFDSIYELYKFLKSDPEVNKMVFSKELSSQKKTNGTSRNSGITYGLSYDETLENLVKEDDRNIDLFLELSSAYDNAKRAESEEYKTVYKTSGGRLNNVLYTIGAPRCYEVKQKVIEPKFITVHVNLLITGLTTDKQIYNRAFILLNILSALEKYGYSIDLDTFVETKADNEIIQIFINLKDYRGQLNISDLIKLTFNKDFFRRIIFRVIESLPLKSEKWAQYYGSPSNALINTEEEDLYFKDPISMNIKGEDLYEDFITVIDSLKLSDIIDIESIKEEFKSSSMKLKLK